MKFKVLIITAFLCIAAQAQAFETVSLAYEVALSDLVAPPTLNSRLSFRECDDCERKSIRVTPDTRYIVNGRPMRFERFKEAILLAGDRDSVPVTVLHHLESDTVVSVSVKLK